MDTKDLIARLTALRMVYGNGIVEGTVLGHAYFLRVIQATFCRDLSVVRDALFGVSAIFSGSSGTERVSNQ